MSLFSTVEISSPAYTPPGVTHVTVKSPALRRRADLTCYASPQVTSDDPLPVVTLLHGVYGSHWAWLGKGGAHHVLEALLSSGEIPPMMLVMPSDGLFGDGSAYLRHAEADYARWIVEEVPAAVAQVDERTHAAPQFITGLSMGGYGALRLGALYPETFRAFSGMSSVTAFANLARFVEPSGHVYDLAESAPLGVLDCLLTQRASLRPFRFDCGLDDPLLEENRALHEALSQAGVAHDYAEHPGGHEWDYWHHHLADQLRFFTRTLLAET
jgi:putative tributyrin esterase